MTISVKRQMFSIKGRDVFQLTLEYVLETNQYHITTSLPQWIVDQYPKPVLELKQQHPYFDIQQVTQKLQELGIQLLQNEYTKHFHYPKLLLDARGRFKSESCMLYQKSVDSLHIKKLPYVSAISRPFETLFLSQAISNIQYNIACTDNVSTIRRNSFERNLTSEKHKDDYIDLYYAIKSFVLVESANPSDNLYSFLAALDNKRNVMMAFLNYSLELTLTG